MSRRTDDTGSAAMELVLVTPVLVLCAVFVFWGGRLGEARSLVDLAASRGARAASLVSRSRMDSVGRAASIDTLRNNGASCSSLGVSVSVMEQYVRVTVNCVSNGTGVSPFGTRTLTASALAPIDHYRAD